MANKEAEDLEDTRLIVREVARFLAMPIERLMAHFKSHKHDSLATIPHPTCGTCFCGLAGSDRFWTIARRHLKANPDQRSRVEPSQFVDDLKAAFSANFIPTLAKPTEELAEPTKILVRKMLADASDAAEKRFVALTHYIPCAIFLSKAVKRFSLGPVEFVHESEFWASHDAELQAMRGDLAARYAKQNEQQPAGLPAVTAERAAEIANRQIDEVTTFFRDFNWLAVVSIDSCDDSVSYDRAIYLTRRALDVIKLLLGEYYTQRLRTAADHGHARKSAKLFRGPAQDLQWSLASTPNDDVVGDNWLPALTQNEQFELAAKALTLVASRSDAPLCIRFIDALAWYGDAVSERQPGAKIVKFVTAIERIAGTGKDDPRGINQIIKSRAGILYHLYSEKPIEEATKTVTRVYGWRSGLVHGSTSPFDPSLNDQLHEVAAVTRLVVLAALDFFSQLGIASPGMDNEALRAEYRALEAHYPMLAKANNLDELFRRFLAVLSESLEQVPESYFAVPVAGRADPIYRERAFCYELYHQLRLKIPQDSRFAYWLTGELDKRGHPLINSRVAPDLVLHEPGSMNQNFCVMEIKPINGKAAGIRKDISTLIDFTTNHGYHAGILLFYGERRAGSRKTKLLSTELAKLRAARITVVWVKSPHGKMEILN
ncbi:MAG: HEPN domain-containing protein [Opitutaceae bacterium]|nr:HEPN domain-containing protein [Opitutaceae bacterium]